MKFELTPQDLHTAIITYVENVMGFSTEGKNVNIEYHSTRKPKVSTSAYVDLTIPTQAKPVKETGDDTIIGNAEQVIQTTAESVGLETKSVATEQAAPVQEVVDTATPVAEPAPVEQPPAEEAKAEPESLFG